MTDCSSIQGSTSSSSDVMTLTTAASSWCAIPTNSRIRILRLVRPHHPRRMLMVTGPESSPSFGFAVRGGKEFGTGFFVSQIERNSEADAKGLRIGDQILRLNGFRVEDAVHKEFVRFIGSQDRITLKVRGVGMLPIKDKENERLSWNVVKMHSVSNTPSESSYRTITTEHSSTSSAVGVTDSRCKDISVVLDVAPRTKLGLGICKGPEWKPGIFVQFTKEKSVARDAGLCPGDQILSVNSIDFSDVLFSEAVAVMKSSNKLEMLVRTAAGCDLFPGESSGYNSSASSVTGDQSPCWADVKQKRLTAVHEEPMLASCWNEALYAAQHRSRPKELNKTIIKLSENGTSINNTYVANPQMKALQFGSGSGSDDSTLKKSVNTPSPPPPPPPSHSTANELYSNVEQRGRVQNRKTDLGVHHRHLGTHHESQQQLQPMKNSTKTSQSQSPPSSSPSSKSSQAISKPKSIGPPKAPPPAFYSNLTNYATKTSDNNNFCNQIDSKSNNFVDVGAAGSTLSSAIEEELKKRKEKQRSTNNLNNNCNYDNGDQHQKPQQRMTTSTVTMQHQHQHQHPQQHQHHHHHEHRHQHNQLYHQHQHPHQHHQTQQQQSRLPLSSTTSKTCTTTTTTKRSPSVRAVSSIAANCSDRNSNMSSMCSSNAVVVAASSNTLDQHSALMDEFKRAHQRMFKNGFHERETKERQEALKRTTFMNDDTSHRTTTTTMTTTAASRSQQNDVVDGSQCPQQQQQQQQQQLIPPPPPQFANSPPKSNQQNYQTIKQSNASEITKAVGSKAPRNDLKVLRPPNSPVPDYDQQQSKAEKFQLSKQNTTKTASALSGNLSASQRTIRLGTVTIGEYDQHRKEPNKFDFVNGKNGNGNGNSNGNGNVNGNTNGNGSFHHELQSTLQRSKLKHGGHLEHKQNCPLRNGYGVENVTRNLQGVHINQKQPQSPDYTATVKRNVSQNVYGTGNGILKNSNSRVNGSNTNGNTGHTSKIIEKTITFGN